MPDNLDQILITAASPKWHEKLRAIHAAVRKAAFFSPGDENDKALQSILTSVRRRKDQALIEYTQKFDNVTLTAGQLRISEDNLKKAHRQIDTKLLASIRQAIENVRKYQAEIFIAGKPEITNHPGIKYTTLRRVGLCIPGASAPLPSAVIMTAMPAQVAGVEQIAVVSPPRYKNTIHPTILATCCELGISEVYRIGGAHAVAALAYGTETIEPVDKIAGPGNQWVQMAKKRLYGTVDIDSVAGPSEVLIIADDSANPAWAAADMLSQAEHNPGCALLFTTSEKLAQSVLEKLDQQLGRLSRAEATRRCLIDYGAIIVFKNIDDLITQANFFAAEHLQVQCGRRSKQIADRIRNAGAIFVGPYSPVAVGDYWAGPSHTLPTGTTARFFSPLSANDFIKSTSIIEYDQAALARVAEDIIRLAKTEGLDAHANSVRIRQQKDPYP